MAKAAKTKKEEVKVETKKKTSKFDLRVTLDKSAAGRLTVKVALFENGEEVASDYDFVQVD